MDIAQNFINDWQEITDILAQVCDVPAALIMKLSGPDIEVLVSSQNEGNPYSPGDKEYFEDSGLYCETVIKSKNKLLVPDALMPSQKAPDSQSLMCSEKNRIGCLIEIVNVIFSDCTSIRLHIAL